MRLFISEKNHNHNQRKHITIVHDEILSNVRFVITYLKLFNCEICDKNFERKYELKKHIIIVHDENLSNVRFVMKYLKLFKCDICDKIFERKYELRKNITIVHDKSFMK
jgi:hypothetical protein